VEDGQMVQLFGMQASQVALHLSACLVLVQQQVALGLLLVQMVMVPQSLGNSLLLLLFATHSGTVNIFL
jgi:hypothetical protein